MKHFAALILAAAFPFSAFAGSGSYIVIVGRGTPSVSVTQQMSADYVGIPVTIRGSAKDAAKRLDDIVRARSMLEDAVKKSGTLEVQWVNSSFSAEAGSSFSKLSSSSYGADSQSRLFILGKVSEPCGTLQVVRKIIAVIAGVPPIDDVGISTGESSLGIVDPEQYRGKLITLINEEAARLKSGFRGVAQIEVSGLEAPIAVVQKNDCEASLFLPYRLSLTKK